MNTKNLAAAIAEAKRFLEKAESLHSDKVRKSDNEIRSQYIWGCKASGSVRRASMDLTRALADLRRANP